MGVVDTDVFICHSLSLFPLQDVVGAGCQIKFWVKPVK